jgi:hypothetical protein
MIQFRHSPREPVAGRLSALGFDVAEFRAPAENPLFWYLKGLSTKVVRITRDNFAPSLQWGRAPVSAAPLQREQICIERPAIVNDRARDR